VAEDNSKLEPNKMQNKPNTHQKGFYVITHEKLSTILEEKKNNNVSDQRKSKHSKILTEFSKNLKFNNPFKS
jgi:hypothetical protein